MFSDIFITIAAFLYHNAILIALVIIALTVLNGVRKIAVARRKRRALKRRAKMQPKKPAFQTFDTI